MTTKDAAIGYTKRGWSIFPCNPKAKTPATAHGFKNASSDPETVVKMFAGKSDYNVAVSTGKGSGIWVLDCDPGWDDDTDFVRLLRDNGGLPRTFRQQTPRGGEHYFFSLNGEEINCRTKIGNEPIDVRGTGGYIVLAPSKTADGDYVIADESAPIMDAPAWLIDYVTSKESADSALTQGNLKFTVVLGDLDLETDPGTTKGGRHDRAMRLIGSAYSKGLDLVEVGQQALAWAGRCDPPMDADEVLRLVQDLGKKEKVKVDVIEDEPLPEAPEWPTLGDHAYHGLAGEIVKAIDPQTEADPVAILVQILSSFGNLVGRTPHFMVEGTPHCTNLYSVLVGATARGRKGTSEGRVRQLLRAADEEWATHRIASGLVSGEGIVWAVRDPIVESKPVKVKGKIVGYEEVVSDPGIDDKRLMVVESEFSSVLRAGRRETSTLSPTLRSAWDSGDLRTLAKNSPARSTGAHISLIGHITQEELKRTMPEFEGFSGFANRFLWIAVRRSKLLPDGGEDLDLSSFADRLRAAAEHAKFVGRMHRDKPAAKLWRAVYADLAGGTAAGMFGAVTSRAEAQALRLSMVYALLDRSTTITTEHIGAAVDLWRYAEASARMIFGSSIGNILADKILALIKSKPGVGRRDMHRHLGNNIKAAAIAQALAEIRDAGLARVEKVSTGGRPGEQWFAAENKPRTNEVSKQSLSGEGVSLVSSFVRRESPDKWESFTV